ncbi:MAG: VWA domain-containing protein [Acidobacteriota bacterium]
MLLTALLLSPAASAQDEDPRASFVERLQVNVRNVEVFVTDKKGRPILDLTADDFEILEDGKPMPLTNFLAPAPPTAGATDAAHDAATATSQPATAVNSPATEATDRHLILFVDNLNIRPGNRQRVLGEVRRFLDDLGDRGGRIMVASHDGSINIRQGFTNDLDQVHAALDSLGKLSGPALARQSERTALMREAQQILNMVRQVNSTADPTSSAASQDLKLLMQMTEDQLSSLMQQVESTSHRLHLDNREAVLAVSRFVDALAALAGRKALIYVSDGLMMRPGEELFWAMGESFEQGRRLRFRDRPADSGQNTDGQSGNSSGGEPLETDFDSSELKNLVSFRTRSQRYSLARYFDQLTAVANTHRVSFYTIDARGGASGLTEAGVEGRLGAIYSAGLRGIRNANLWETLDVMSGKTGGVTLTGGDVQSLLQRATDDFTAYYSLGYSPPHLGDGQRHAIKVKVKRRGAKARYRQSYIDKPLRGKIEDRTTAALLLELDDNRHGILVETLEPAPGERKGQYTVPMLVKIPLAQVALLPRGEVHACDAKLYITSLNPEGSAGPVHEVVFSIEVPNHDLGKVFGQHYTARMDMVLPAGEQKLAVGFWDQMAAEGSFLSHRITVDAGSAKEL